MAFPEQPLLVYPSLARRYGVEAALLLYLYNQQLEHLGHGAVGAREVTIGRDRWLALAPFWDEETLAVLTAQLSDAGAIQASLNGMGITLKEQPVPQAETTTSIAPTQLSQSRSAPARVPESGERQQTQCLPVYDAPPVQPRRQVPVRNSIRERGPAPTFGGSIGWKKRSADELERVFAEQEQRNRMLHPMELGWRPSQMFFASLASNSIPQEFAERYLDEFVLHFANTDKKERSWDQRFLAWVKREWVKQQGNDNRQISSNANLKHENARPDTRENRKRVTAAIMDIKDTDW